MSEQKPAYLVASSFMSRGHGSLDEYASKARPLLEAAGAELVVFGGPDQPLEHLEGAWNSDAQLTVLRFPSMEALKGFWDSPEYQAIKHLRTDVIPPNFTVAVASSL
ncbi:hypothetical protein GCM10007094_32480 [Pseudovibrio japonicus]|uniref:DUF1330 domain-containing protein n=1 Tax=Pseudovibrio japonicus TaxID=366534 RepID=A0ABQ3EJX0_9HYPH|nr:DUF1330 domain-containing protein [Pseudovibrio japonicus]GHB40599.1 hypothetical protein GCM10007094_32480 [Pseudovibrio japonicus]